MYPRIKNRQMPKLPEGKPKVAAPFVDIIDMSMLDLFRIEAESNARVLEEGAC